MVECRRQPDGWPEMPANLLHGLREAIETGYTPEMLCDRLPQLIHQIAGDLADIKRKAAMRMGGKRK